MALDKDALMARSERAYELHLNGWNTREIGAELGISHTSAQKDIARFSDALSLPDMETWRKASYGRMAIVSRTLMEQIRAGTSVARNAEVLARIEERVATMLGADADQHVDVEVVHTVAPSILAAIDRASLHAQQVLPPSDHMVIDSNHDEIPYPH